MIQDNTIWVLTELSPWLLPGPILILVMTLITDIDFAQGVWDYKDIDNYIKEKSKTTDSEGKEVFPITLTFHEPTFRVLITLEKDYRLDLTKSNFH